MQIAATAGGSLLAPRGWSGPRGVASTLAAVAALRRLLTGSLGFLATTALAATALALVLGGRPIVTLGGRRGRGGGAPRDLRHGVVRAPAARGPVEAPLP